jgi:hypothetical protein
MIIKGVYIHLPRPPSPFTRSITIPILNVDQNLADFQVWSDIMHKSYIHCTTTKDGLMVATRV